MSATSENNLGGSIGLDVTAFKAGVLELTNQMKQVETSFRASAAVMGSWSTSTQGLTERTESLQKKLDLQKEALTRLHAEYDLLSKAEGNHEKEQKSLADQMYSMEQKISSTEGQLKKYQSSLQAAQKDEKENSSTMAQLGKAFTNLSEQSKKTTSGIAEHFSGIKSAVTGAATGIAAALTGGAGLIAFSNDAIKAGDNAYILSQKMHLPADQAALLNRELGLTNTDSQAFIGTLTRLDKTVESAASKGTVSAGQIRTAQDKVAESQAKLTEAQKKYASGSSQVLAAQTNLSLAQTKLSALQDGSASKTNATVQALEKFGVKLTDSTGKLLPMNQQLAALAAGYQKASENGNEEAYTAQILGNRGVALTGILSDYKNVAEQAGKVKGIGIDPEMAHKVEQELTAVKGQVSQLGLVAGNAMLPLIQQIIPQAQSGLANLATQVKSHQSEIKAIISNITSVAQSMISTVLPPIQSTVEFLGGRGIGVLAAIAGAIGTVKAAILAANVVQAVNNALMVTAAINEKGLAAGEAALSAAKGNTTLATMALSAATIKSAVATAAKKAADLAGVVATNAQTVATNAAGAAQQFLNAALNANPIGIVITAIAALVAALVVLYNNNKQFRDFINGMWASIKSAAQAVGNWFSGPFVGFFKGAWTGITGAFSSAQSFFGKLGNGIKQGFEDSTKGSGTPIQNMVTNSLNMYKNMFAKIGELIKNSPIGQWFANAFSAAGNAIKNVANAITTPFVTAFTNLKNSIISIVTPIVQGLSNAWNGIKTAASGAWEIIKNTIMAPVLLICDLVTGNFGKMQSDMSHIWTNIQNASRQVWEGLKQYFTGVWQAISGGFTAFGNVIVTGASTAWNLVKTGATMAWNAITQFFILTFNNIKNLFIAAFNAYWRTVFTVGNTIKTGIITLWNSIIAWFQALPGTLMTIGANMFTAMQNGVNSTINNVVTAVKTGIGAAIDWIKGLPGEALQWGKDMLQGFIDGIRSKISDLKHTVENIGNEIRKKLHFSRPDEGPLADYETWMPDFMAGLAKGIEANKFKVAAAMQNLAADMSKGISVPVRTAYAGGYSAPSTAAPAYTFYQYNTSPVPLSPSETARQTRNVIRQAVLQSKRG